MKVVLKKLEFFLGVFKDLGMKIIELLMWIYESMNDVEINV